MFCQTSRSAIATRAPLILTEPLNRYRRSTPTGPPLNLFGIELNTPEQIAAWLGGSGAFPPHYSGPGQALRFDADDRALADAGALLALDKGTPRARAEAILSLQGLGSPTLDAATSSILASPPAWWSADNPSGGTFGHAFLQMATYGNAARNADSGRLLTLARGTPVEDEVIWAVLAWRPDGPALDQLIERLGAGTTFPADRWARVAGRLANRPRLTDLVEALKLHHGADVRAAVVNAAPAAAALWVVPTKRTPPQD